MHCDDVDLGLPPGFLQDLSFYMLPRITCFTDSFKIFFFNWRIIALQYCIGFCHKSAWISQSRHISPPTPLDCREHPVLCRNFSLAICFTYGNVYISMILCAPCVMQKFFTSYLFYIWKCIYFNDTLSIHHTLSFPHCVHRYVLYICDILPYD